MEKIAILADIHGNLPALDAALAKIDAIRTTGLRQGSSCHSYQGRHTADFW